MCDENQVTPCCSRHSRPEQQCDRYPMCNACQHLIADDGPVRTEPSEYPETAFGPAGFEGEAPVEAVREPLY